MIRCADKALDLSVLIDQLSDSTESLQWNLICFYSPCPGEMIQNGCVQQFGISPSYCLRIKHTVMMMQKLKTAALLFYSTQFRLPTELLARRGCCAPWVYERLNIKVKCILQIWICLVKTVFHQNLAGKILEADCCIICSNHFLLWLRPLQLICHYWCKKFSKH